MPENPKLIDYSDVCILGKRTILIVGAGADVTARAAKIMYYPHLLIV